MTEFKYIIIELTKTDGVKNSMPVIFGKEINHNDMSQRTVHNLWQNDNVESAKTVSGGFVYLGDGIECHGRSETLDMDSRKQDAEIITGYKYSYI